MALVTSRYPVLIFMPADEAAVGLRALASDLRRKGAALLIAAHGDFGPGGLPALTPDHPDTDAVCLIQSFYAYAVQLAERRGVDRERPRHLQKVTRTR